MGLYAAGLSSLVLNWHDWTDGQKVVVVDAGRGRERKHTSPQYRESPKGSFTNARIVAPCRGLVSSSTLQSKGRKKQGQQKAGAGSVRG